MVETVTPVTKTVLVLFSNSWLQLIMFDKEGVALFVSFFCDFENGSVAKSNV